MPRQERVKNKDYRLEPSRPWIWPPRNGGAKSWFPYGMTNRESTLCIETVAMRQTHTAQTTSQQ